MRCSHSSLSVSLAARRSPLSFVSSSASLSIISHSLCAAFARYILLKFSPFTSLISSPLSMWLSFADVLVMLGSGIDATCFVQLLVVSFFSIARIN
ncbi:hypothetical protein BVRB_6g145480 [Beta vulgaris subsp. vulgaris]|nr:hypothetical protein BVRB_6g145480 [Beta vulgaris subsp. vulgaris]